MKPTVHDARLEYVLMEVCQMNVLRRSYGDFLHGRPAIGLLIFRVVTGLALMIHGYPKMQKPMSWMGPEAAVPGFMQFLAAIAEFGGGLALVLGFLTPLACLGIVFVMLGALLLVHIPAGHKWIGGGGGSMEPAIGYMTAAILLFFTGPGSISLDRRIFGKHTPSGLSVVKRKEPASIK